MTEPRPIDSVVLVKQVPDTHNDTADVMTRDGTMNRGALSAIFNPEDLNALEMALQVRDRHGGTVTVITMGPPKAADILRESLWRGADRVILLTDRRFAGADTLATSLALQKAIEKIGRYDLVLAGRQAIDGDTAQVGPQTAEKLGIPQITYAESILEIADGRIVAQRALDSGSEIVRCRMPCLLTVVGSANSPRPPSVRRRIALKLAATAGEHAALQKQWPEFGDPEALAAHLSGRRTTSVQMPRPSAWPARRRRSTRSTSWSWRAPRARPSSPPPRPSPPWWRSWSTSTSSGRRP
jgi:electron transfer flavoprotein beta subunit